MLLNCELSNELRRLWSLMIYQIWRWRGSVLETYITWFFYTKAKYEENERNPSTFFYHQNFSWSIWEDFDFDTMGPQFYGDKRRQGEGKEVNDANRNSRNGNWSFSSNSPRFKEKENTGNLAEKYKEKGSKCWYGILLCSERCGNESEPKVNKTIVCWKMLFEMFR